MLGAGPVGCELAQAFRRLGSEVAVVDIGPILPKDDPELTAVVRARLWPRASNLYEHVKVLAAEPGPALVIEGGSGRQHLSGTHLLVAAGRKANVEELGLDVAGIAQDQKGIKVDARLRTTNARVFAIGDVAGGLQLTHLAAIRPGIVIRNALFRLSARASNRAMPWVTFTDPELATVGLRAADARARGIGHEVVRWSFADNDRARAERATEVC